MKPVSVLINGMETPCTPTVNLREGRNSITMQFDTYGVSRFVVRDGSGRHTPDLDDERPLSMKYRSDLSILPLDTRESDDTYAEFSFTTPPGLQSMELTAFAKPEVCLDSMVCTVEAITTRGDGAVTYLIALPETALRESHATIVVAEPWGYAGGAVIDGPVKFNCGKGIYHIGDWSDNESLRTYSGAAVYSTEFPREIKALEEIPEKLILDLGDVVASATVSVNGKEAETRLAAPWRFDIAPLLQTGSNTIEIRVCNTTANILLSSPTGYRGSTRAGLIGPVRFVFD